MSEDAQAPAEEQQEVSAPSLGVNDLKLMANIIEVVSNRGAIKANEMQAVGVLYNNLMTFLVANGAVEVPQPEVEEEASAEGENND
jgi:hypothetical protein